MCTTALITQVGIFLYDKVIIYLWHDTLLLPIQVHKYKQSDFTLYFKEAISKDVYHKVSIVFSWTVFRNAVNF